MRNPCPFFLLPRSPKSAPTHERKSSNTQKFARHHGQEPTDHNLRRRHRSGSCLLQTRTTSYLTHRTISLTTRSLVCCLVLMSLCGCRCYEFATPVVVPAIFRAAVCACCFVFHMFLIFPLVPPMFKDSFIEAALLEPRVLTKLLVIPLFECSEELASWDTNQFFAPFIQRHKLRDWIRFKVPSLDFLDHFLHLLRLLPLRLWI